MANLDLDETERVVERDGFLAPGLAREAITELRRRRSDAERDLRFMQQQMAEVASLKRRISTLRGVLKRDGWKHVLATDDDVRRRFEAKQRKAARR